MSERTPFALLSLAGTGLLVLLPAAFAQSPELVPTLRADGNLVRKLQAARDRLRAEDWAEATRLLQGLIDGPEDALLEVKRIGKDGKEAVFWTGIRGEAIRLLTAMPADGLEFYRLTYVPLAQALFAEAKKKGDAERLAEVARRYPTTKAGAEAAELVAAFQLDRARFTHAALCYGDLLEGANAERLSAATLFRAALAFRGAGDAVRSEQAWKQLTAKAPGGLRLGDKEASLTDLKKELDRVSRPAPARPAVSPETLANLEAHWTRSTTYGPNTKDYVEAAVRRQEARDQPVLPGFFPIVAGGKIVYRSHQGLHAVDFHSGKEAWQTPFTWSLDRATAKPRFASFVESWVGSYLENSPHVLYENAIPGTLSTDGVRVYAVDDLGIPPYRTIVMSGRFRQAQPWPDFGPELNGAAESSRLLALDVATGKPTWEAGGKGKEGGALSEVYFLGPPLPLDDRLYSLIEKNNEIALACLNAGAGTLRWKQPLAYAPTRLLLDPGRRIQAAQPVYGEGVLVCPTYSGMVLAVNPVTPSLVWAYPYQTEPLTQSLSFRRGRPAAPRVTAAWKAPFLHVAGGRVLFTAPDEPSIHCLNARDGSLLWKVHRAEDDLFVAGVFANKILVIGRQECRALDLADGRQLWKVETGLPSGRGTVRGNLYYLPVREEPWEGEPAVCVLDVRKGTVVTYVPWAEKEGLGNLLFADGEIFSQTAASVAAFPGRKGGAK